MPGDAEQDVLSRVRDFAAERVARAAAGWSMGEAPDGELFAQAADLGLMGLELPVDRGGLGLGFALKARVCETLAGADFGFAMSVVNTHNVALRLVLDAPQRVQDNHLPRLLSGEIGACTALSEPGAGSDFAAIETRAMQTSGGWVLNGEKAWIVNARRAGLAMVFAQCGEAGDSAGIGAFLVDLSAPGVRRYPIESGFSQTSIGTGGFVLDAVELPDENLLLPPGTAFKTILTEINGARAYLAAMCNGMLRAALEQVSAYGARRRSFGKPLSAHQAWRLGLARAEADLAATAALTARAVRQVDSGEDAQLSAAEAKIGAVETCQRHLPALLHSMGAEGLRPEHCFTRHLAAAQMAALTDGSTEMLLERVARLKAASTNQSNRKE